ncbi:hypothetical protein NDU88_002329 [Pleurodeles waltl]|uniref:Uncharacterized protein n=1 Tax=Pleurodeles waltl TaxID=8319 RepID=A0AAV7M3L9_PLEWA|nr:hypothetical protein NDU88_002329 [Pleurodeles waltl]
MTLWIVLNRERGAWPRWRREQTCLSVLRHVGLRHGFAAPVGVKSGGLRIAPDAPDGGVPRRARDACGTGEREGGAAGPVPTPSAGGRSSPGRVAALVPCGLEEWCGGSPGGRHAAGALRGL